MAAPDPSEIAGALIDRQQADRAFDEWGTVRSTYEQWHGEILDVYNIYEGNWDVVWPDKVRTRALPKITNFIQLAADDRARTIAATPATIVCRPEKAGDAAKAKADKLERIIGGWLEESRVQRVSIPRWGHDAMAGGLTVCRVMPDYTKPVDMRYPVFTRLQPTLCYPDPIFTEGPFVDNMIYAYEEKVRTVSKKYGLDLTKERPFRDAQTDNCRVVEFYNEDWVVVFAESLPGRHTGIKSSRVVLLTAKHGMGRTPVAIGARPTMTGRYAGEFFGSLGVLNYANRLFTLMLDDAVSKVYAAKMYYDIENPEEYGPDALLEMQSPNGTFQYVAPPNQPFTNLQIVRDTLSSARASTMMPPSRSGDPNESIISSSGISATQSQFVEDVKAIQRDILSPMLEAAIELALAADEMDGDVTKSISCGPMMGGYRETYKPSKDIAGYRKVNVTYGLGAGLDEINTNVMVLQQWAGGQGLISKRTAQEQSPFIDDPQREEKQQAMERLDDAMFAGLMSAAQQGQLSSSQLAFIRKAVESDGVSLTDAIQQATALAPLAAPSQTAASPTPEAPGLAGAGQGLSPQSPLPPLNQLLGQPGG